MIGIGIRVAVRVRAGVRVSEEDLEDVGRGVRVGVRVSEDLEDVGRVVLRLRAVILKVGER